LQQKSLMSTLAATVLLMPRPEGGTLKLAYRRLRSCITWCGLASCVRCSYRQRLTHAECASALRASGWQCWMAVTPQLPSAQMRRCRPR
jgi:hypothetical protein